MRVKAVGCETLSNIKTGCAARNQIEQGRADDRADDLRNHIGQNLAGGKTPARGKTDRNGGIEVTTGYMADGIGHGYDAQTERQGYADQTDPDLRKAGSDDRAAAACKCEPERSDQFGRIFPCFHINTSRTRPTPPGKSSPKAANSGMGA